MKNLLIILLSLFFLAAMAMAEEEKNLPVYDVLKPMEITASAKIVDNDTEKAKNDAVYNAKLAIIQEVINAFVINTTDFSEEINNEIMSKLNSYIKDVNVDEDSIKTSKDIMTLTATAKVDVMQIYEKLCDIDYLPIMSPLFIVKIGNVDVLDKSTIESFENGFIETVNKMQLKGKNSSNLLVKENLSIDNIYSEIIKACNKKKIKLLIVIDPTNNIKSTAGLITSTVTLTIKPVNTSNGEVLDNMNNLVGTHQNIFSSTKNETTRAFNKCLNNLYEFHLKELKALILNAWVDVQNKK